MIRSHGTKLHILVSKLRSGTFKTKAGALFWKSHCATCSPVYVILYHVTGSCKGPIAWCDIAPKKTMVCTQTLPVRLSFVPSKRSVNHCSR